MTQAANDNTIAEYRELLLLRERVALAEKKASELWLKNIKRDIAEVEQFKRRMGK